MYVYVCACLRVCVCRTKTCWRNNKVLPQEKQILPVLGYSPGDVPVFFVGGVNSTHNVRDM